MRNTPWLLLLALLGFGCSSSSGDAPPAPGATASSEQAFAFCQSTCEANATCSASYDRAACLKQCDTVAQHPVIRADFASEATRCAGMACLDFQSCVFDVSAKLPETAALQKWCDDFAAKRAACGKTELSCPSREQFSDEELAKLSECLTQSDCFTYVGCLD
jgi:hypothetical protein